MTQLTDILQLPYFSGLSAADCLASGNLFVNLPQDPTPYTWSGIGQKLLQNGVSASDYITLTTSIDTLPGGSALDKCLSSGGFNFADATNRAIIMSEEVSEPQWAVNVLNAMLNIGAPSGTTWQLYGVTQPTLNDCTNALATISSNINNKNQQSQISNFVYTEINPLMTQNLTASGFKIAVQTALNNWSPS